MEQPDGYSFKVTTMCLAELNFGSMRTAALTHSCAKRYSGATIYVRGKNQLRKVEKKIAVRNQVEVPHYSKGSIF